MKTLLKTGITAQNAPSVRVVRVKASPAETVSTFSITGPNVQNPELLNLETYRKDKQVSPSL